MQFSSLGSSKMEISETDFFDTLTIQNDQISYVKHVLAPFYVFFTLFGCWGGECLLFFFVKGAYDMSLKRFILRLLLCTSALL